MHRITSSKGLNFITSIISCTKSVYHAQNRYLYCLCDFHWSQTRDNNSLYYRKNINFMYVHFWATQSMDQKFISKRLKTVKLKIIFVSSFEFQTKNYVTCFGHICNHPHGQENYTQKYINAVSITV